MGDSIRCKKAIKLLTQFERLARKYQVKIPPGRLQRLRDMRDRGIIKSTDLPATLQAEFPSEFAGMTLDAIRNQCGMA